MGHYAEASTKATENYYGFTVNVQVNRSLFHFSCHHFSIR